MHPYEEEIREEVQEACMDEQGAPGQTEGWEKGQVSWEEYIKIAQISGRLLG